MALNCPSGLNLRSCSIRRPTRKTCIKWLWEQEVDQAGLNLFVGAENVQQSGNVAANEDQEILQIEVTEPKLLISKTLKHTKNLWEQPTFVPVYIQTFSGYRRLKVFWLFVPKVFFLRFCIQNWIIDVRNSSNISILFK